MAIVDLDFAEAQKNCLRAGGKKLAERLIAIKQTATDPEQVDAMVEQVGQ